jgi:glycosyltransferase involved in cell wall biosynthesis
MAFHGRGDRELFWDSPPLDILWQLQAHLFYAPFGLTDHHCPGIPTIAYVVDLLHLDYPESITSKESQYRYQYFEAMARQADFFQCSTDYVSQRLCNTYQIGTEKIIKTAPVFANQSKSALHSKTASPPVNKYFYYPANFWVHKNHTTLLVAYAHYVSKEQGKAWDLVLTGFDSPEAHEILSYLDSLGIRDRVRYEGYVSEKDLNNIWSSASALVFPSVYEGFGIPLVEAMARKLPIICGRDACLEEVAGKAALYVESRNPLSIADALVQLSSSDVLYSQLSFQAYARFQEFSGDQEMEKLAAMVEKCLTSNSPRLTTIGFKENGQINRNAAFNVLQKGALLLEGKWKTENSAVQLRIRCGIRQAGSWILQKNQTTTLCTKIYSDGAPIVLEFTEHPLSSPTKTGKKAALKKVALYCKSLVVHGNKGIEEIYPHKSK